MQQKADFEFSCPLRVRYAEVDTQGIVFNAHYLMYFDLAVTEYFRWRGLAYAEFQEKFKLDFHVIRSLLNYKTPARFDDQLDICARATYRGAKIFWDMSIFRGEELICNGELIYATVDNETRRVKKLEPDTATFLGFTVRESAS